MRRWAALPPRQSAPRGFAPLSAHYNQLAHPSQPKVTLPHYLHVPPTVPSVGYNGQAFELSGGYTAVQAAKVLADQAFLAIDASVASNEASLAKLETRELVAHKATVALGALDPEKTQVALGQLYLCWMSMLATLKIQFARTVSLGLSISRSLKPFGEKVGGRAIRLWG